jgi:hypothetical protein
VNCSSTPSRFKAGIIWTLLAIIHVPGSILNGKCTSQTMQGRSLIIAPVSSVGAAHTTHPGLLLTAFKLCSHIWEQKKGSFFTGVFLPKKSVLLPPIKTQYKPFQKHVSSYQVKSTPVWFVWAAPTLLTGAMIKNRPCIV